MRRYQPSVQRAQGYFSLCFYAAKLIGTKYELFISSDKPYQHDKKLSSHAHELLRLEILQYKLDPILPMMADTSKMTRFVGLICRKSFQIHFYSKKCHGHSAPVLPNFPKLLGTQRRPRCLNTSTKCLKATVGNFVAVSLYYVYFHALL